MSLGRIMSRENSLRAVTQLLVVVLVVSALAFAEDFLRPIAIAFLVTVFITAAKDRFQRLGLSEALALSSSLLVFILVTGVAIYVLGVQVDAIGEAWPRYVDRFYELVHETSRLLGPTLSAKLGETYAKLDLTKTVPGLLGSAGGILGNFLLIGLYVGFMLAERGALSSKLTSLFERPEHAAKARDTALEIIGGIRDYIWMKTLISAFTATVSYAVLKLLGVDFAETWALLIFVLDYIPNIGSVLGILFPAVLALIQFDTSWQFLVIAVLLTSTQFIFGNVVQPAFMGRSLNLSALVVIVSLAFWGTLWELTGALLSVPLTAAIAIACSKIPSWRWFAVLVSKDGRIDAR